ncbi:MAG TPA: alpha/beta hydrolase [Methylomirabilota bacterium]|nr:alpha/beta hydrolase [Methylomirabilota bacterium]
MVTRAFLDTPEGQIHYRSAGAGRPVLLLHQTPRSSDEYRDVIPLLARELRVVAMDTIGYGNSYKPAGTSTIEDYAAGALALLDGLGIPSAAVVGHHTGAVVAVELAATQPARVERLVLSASPYVDAEDRERRRGRPPIDEVEAREDGSHLAELWRRRLAFYPKGRPDLLTRFVLDALRAGQKVEEGHRAVSAYRMETKVGRIRCPTLLVCGTEDPFSYPRMGPLAAAIPGSRAVPIPGGTVAMVDQMPEAFAAAILPFLRGQP